MSKIDHLNVRLSKLLSKAVQEVLEVVKETVLEYQEKTARTQRENHSLKRRLQELQEKIDTERNGIVAPISPLSQKPEEFRPSDKGEVKEDVEEHSWRIRPSCAPEDAECEARITAQSLRQGRLCTGDTSEPEDRLKDSNPAVLPQIPNQGNQIFAVTVSDQYSGLECAPPFHTDEIKVELKVEEEAPQASDWFCEASGTSTSSLDSRLNLESSVSSAPILELGVTLNQQDLEVPGPVADNTSSPLSGGCFVNSMGTGNRRTLGGSSGFRHVKKRYGCSLCGRAFAHAGDFKKHSRVHTGERPYSCPVCGKRFSQSGYLKVHMRSHTGEKPFVCPHCGKSFSHSSSLRKHLQTHQR